MEDPVQIPKEKVDMVDIRKFFGKMREKTECGKDKPMQSDGLARQQDVDECGNETECRTAMQTRGAESGNVAISAINQGTGFGPAFRVVERGMIVEHLSNL